MARIHIMDHDLPNAGLIVGDSTCVLDNTVGWGKHKTEENYLAAHPFLRIIWVNALPVDRARRFMEQLFRKAKPGEWQYDMDEVDEADRIIWLQARRWSFRTEIDLADTDERNLIREALAAQKRLVLPRTGFNTWCRDRTEEHADTQEYSQNFDVPPQTRKGAREDAKAGLVRPRRG